MRRRAEAAIGQRLLPVGLAFEIDAMARRAVLLVERLAFSNKVGAQGRQRRHRNDWFHLMN
jgi:hypothetical protein